MPPGSSWVLTILKNTLHLVTKPIKNAQPYRSPQLCYIARQRDFTIQTIRGPESMEQYTKTDQLDARVQLLKFKNPDPQVAVYCRYLGSKLTNSPKPIHDAQLGVQTPVCVWKYMLRKYWLSTQLLASSVVTGSAGNRVSPDLDRILPFSPNTAGGKQSRKSLLGGTAREERQPTEQKDPVVGRFPFLHKRQSQITVLSWIILEDLYNIGIKVYAKRFDLCKAHVLFCSGILPAEGIQYHPGHFSSILNIKENLFCWRV